MPKRNRERLQAHILSLSVAQTWTAALEEWALHSIYQVDDAQTCPCGHYPICEICVIENHRNGAQTEVGNVCVTNFLDLDSEVLFAALRRLIADATASANPDLIEYALRRSLISEADRRFYLRIWRKQILSDKQWKWKRDINLRIRAALVRSHGGWAQVLADPMYYRS